MQPGQGPHPSPEQGACPSNPSRTAHGELWFAPTAQTPALATGRRPTHRWAEPPRLLGRCTPRAARPLCSPVRGAVGTMVETLWGPRGTHMQRWTLTFSPLGPWLPALPLVPGSPLRPCGEWMCGWRPPRDPSVCSPHEDSGFGTWGPLQWPQPRLPSSAGQCGPSPGFRKRWEGSCSAVSWGGVWWTRRDPARPRSAQLLGSLRDQAGGTVPQTGR